MKIVTLAAGVAAAAALVCATAQAQTPVGAAAPPPLSYGPPITLEQAKAVVAAAEAEARKRGVAVTIAVVEPSGAVTLSERMTGASYASAETAPNKARSSAVWLRPTSFWAEAVKTNPGVVTFAHVTAGQGGELIVAGGKVIGAIGVGGSGANEGDIAKIGAAALK